MKPVIVANHSEFTPELHSILSECSKSCVTAMGEVLPMFYLEDNSELLQGLHRFADSCGLQPLGCKSRSWQPNLVIACGGSIATHQDNGLGALLSWLVYAEPMIDPPPVDSCLELITAGGDLYLRSGDVFVFNANHRHAWLSNAACLFAQVQVRKTKRFREWLASPAANHLNFF